MAKLIRGKIVVEKKAEETVELPLRDGSTFASDAAPWVGAEQRWRSGIVPPPHEDAAQYLDLMRKVTSEEQEGLTLTMDELDTVLSTLPPAPVSAGGRGAVRRRTSLRLLGYAMVAGIAMVFTWVVVGMRGADNSAKSSSAEGGRSDGAPTQLHAAASPIAADLNVVCPTVVGEDACEKGSEDEEVVSERQLVSEPTVASVEAKAPVAPAPAAVKRSRSAKSSPTKVDAVQRLSVYALANAAPVAEVPVAATETGELSTESSDETNAEISAETSSTHDEDAADPFAEAAIGSMASVLKMAKVERPEASPETLPDYRFSAPPEDDSAAVPDKASIERTMGSIAPEVKKCNRGASGRVVIELDVAGNTGRVVSARAVDPEAVGITAARCAARAVKLAKFPRFDKSRFTVTYSFDI